MNPRACIKPFAKASNTVAFTFLFHTFMLFFISLGTMYLAYPYLPNILAFFAFLSGAFLGGCAVVRLFIIQHDCGHGSFFTNQNINNSIGSLLGIITFTPYGAWRRTHGIHHGECSNLDKRDTQGDITGGLKTLTKAEYQAMSWLKKQYAAAYPVVIHSLGGPIVFFIKQRLTWGKEERRKHGTEIMFYNIIAIALVIALFNVSPTLLITYLVSVTVASYLGVWLFFVQHHFPDTYWATQKEWTFEDAALKGSSFYNLPKWGHWLTGYIGYHNVHHLNPKVPCYHLPTAHSALTQHHTVATLSIKQSLFHCPGLMVWDETINKLIIATETKAITLLFATALSGTFAFFFLLL